jgi:hypothetical protein
MPALATQFVAAAGTAAELAAAGERIRLEANAGSPTRKELRPARIQLLYEMAYLRLFAEWESMLEETFIRLMCGYESNGYLPTIVGEREPFRYPSEARAALYGTRDYLLWHNPATVLQRCQQWFLGGVHSEVIGSQAARLGWFAAVRHRIAHGSTHVKEQMDLATVQLAGRRYPGAASGCFLRDWMQPNPFVQEPWLSVITGELQALARQLAP